MTPSRWAEVKELFYAALDLPESEREAFLSGACCDDSLQAEVRKLLSEEAEAELVSPVAGIFPSPALFGGTAPAAIGRYRILRLLGEGGMGAVYEAEQDQPRRKVALKVIRPGLASPALLRRFEHESQALGRLHHTGIAQIYEAGVAEGKSGPQAYFAMELIQGESLLRHAEAGQLNTRQRLQLMARICEAVHHAHQRGIIHRDLKPANIVVDETGQPKILDFGVARATDSDAKNTRPTDAGELVGTLAYMSPEQVLADPLELDTRSDVYALGVILFELLAGRLPYEIGGQATQAIRTILEEEPARLSSLNRGCRGDIETIVSKALEKDKTRRYPSAAELGADIGRYLRDEPIVARPSTAAYQLRKFARRHSALVVGIGMAITILIAGIAASAREASRARSAEQEALRQRNEAAIAQQAAQAERDRTAVERNRAVAAENQAIQDRNRALAEKHRADAESEAAKAISDFLQHDLLAQASASAQARPDTRPDPDLKVRTVLDRAAARLTGKFDRQPVLEASISQTIGNTYRDLGLYANAQRQVEHALDLRRRALGDNHADTLATRHSLAVLYRDQGKFVEAEAVFARVLEVRRRVLGEWHPDTLDTQDSLAMVYRYQSKFAQAEPLYLKALEGRRRTLGAENAATLSSMNNLAVLYRLQGKYAQAEPLYAGALEVRRRVLGEEHPDTLTSMNNLALLYRSQARYAQAEPLLAKVIEVSRRVLGEDHPNTLTSIANLAFLYATQDRLANAEPLLTTVVDGYRRVLGEEHPRTLASVSDLARVYLMQRRDAEAEPLLTRAVSTQRRVLGEEHPNTLAGMNDLAALYRNQGRYAEAEILYLKIAEIQRRLHGEAHPATLSGMLNLAILYRYAGRYAEATPLLIQVLETRRRILGPEDAGTRAALTALAELRAAERRYADAESLLREALHGEEQQSADSWEHYDRQSLLGLCLAAQSKFEEAEPLLISGYEGLRRRKATLNWPERSAVARAGERVGHLYSDWGKPEKAAAWREKLQADRN